MARIDFEDILDNVKTVLTNNLNTKIVSINSEKDDGIDVPSIDNNAYYLQSLDYEIMNHDPCIVYGIEEIETDEKSYGHTLEKLFISIVVLLSDNGRKEISRIMFRYSRALKEIFEENFRNINSNNYLIDRLTPVPFENLDGSQTYKAIGIIIETDLPS